MTGFSGRGRSTVNNMHMEEAGEDAVADTNLKALSHSEYWVRNPVHSANQQK